MQQSVIIDCHSTFILNTTPCYSIKEFRELRARSREKSPNLRLCRGFSNEEYSVPGFSSGESPISHCSSSATSGFPIRNLKHLTIPYSYSIPYYTLALWYWTILPYLTLPALSAARYLWAEFMRQERGVKVFMLFYWNGTGAGSEGIHAFLVGWVRSWEWRYSFLTSRMEQELGVKVFMTYK